jgi:hypothetical protein
MTRALLAAGVVFALSGHTHAKPPAKHGSPRLSAASPALPPSPPVYVHPAPPLPMLPRVGRVRVEAARDRVVIVEDVQLPRGDWQSGGLDLYIAFGSPGTPVAVDARIMVPSPGGLDARPEEAGDPVAVEHAPRRTAASQPLLGKPQMAGVIAHVKEPQLRRAFAIADAAVLRLRTLLMAPSADATGARDVVVRLGVSSGQPLTLGRIQVASLEAEPWITRAEATLCGPDAIPGDLTVALAGKGPLAGAPAAHVTTIAPEFAVRHPTDDLCIRWWGTPAPASPSPSTATPWPDTEKTGGKE